MSTARVWTPLCLQETPDGLKEALDASLRLVGQYCHVSFQGHVWEEGGVFLAHVEVDGSGELWQWQEGEPVFVREGGV